MFSSSAACDPLRRERRSWDTTSRKPNSYAEPIDDSFVSSTDASVVMMFTFVSKSFGG